MTYRIDPEPCINCGLCRLACPTGAIAYFSTRRREHVIQERWCIDCDLCRQVCPVDCISSHPEAQPEPEQLERARDRARAYAKQNRAALQHMRTDARRVVEQRSGATR